MGFTQVGMAAAVVLCLVGSLGATGFATPITYTVKAGDTLTSIAARFGTTVAAIAEANGLRDAHSLRIGQVLKIHAQRAAPPHATSAAAVRTYTVKSGDTLSAIAERFGVSLSALVDANDLADVHRLRIGQVLRLPDGGTVQNARSVCCRGSNTNPATQTYTVKTGDTLWAIARRHGTTPQRLASLNGISETATLRIGQRLQVPGGAAETQTAAAPTRRAAATSSRGVALVAMARRFLGTPYRWGATGNGAFDCSGFLYAMFRQMGITLPRTSFAMFQVGRPVSRSELRPGDLVFFTTYARGASHAGIYIGGNMFIHASSAGRGVRIDSMSKPYYNARFIGARRHF